MRKGAVIAIILISSMLAFLQPVLAEPTAWMEPQHPTDRDHISLYCRAPGAYDARFTVCSDDGSVCYLTMNETRIDSETWKVDIYGTLKAGTKAHYEVTVTYQNETTGNESTETIGPYHFTVESSLPRPEEDSTPLGAWIILSAAGISAFLWRKRR